MTTVVHGERSRVIRRLTAGVRSFFNVRFEALTAEVRALRTDQHRPAPGNDDTAAVTALLVRSIDRLDRDVRAAVVRDGHAPHAVVLAGDVALAHLLGAVGQVPTSVLQVGLPEDAVAALVALGHDVRRLDDDGAPCAVLLVHHASSPGLPAPALLDSLAGRAAAGARLALTTTLVAGVDLGRLTEMLTGWSVDDAFAVGADDTAGPTSAAWARRATPDEAAPGDLGLVAARLPG
ncbi:hypothetical protein OEB99_07680 [Actinotalea sp. M2MS4P-6]|uniref:hypothetical protein n=1 Tax=Actinotalea sp. M2MS4P-6 TaxID=2983762 RepID=UPI0021E393A9|nr:hypothetical protein [Actinotalea sp. M2MS4P-6]MCV2394183.1 hypothetical protein [Actinotalea sp. M2MS4P-6]